MEGDNILHQGYLLPAALAWLPAPSHTRSLRTIAEGRRGTREICGGFGGAERGGSTRLQHPVSGDLRVELLGQPLDGSEELVVLRQAPLHLFLRCTELLLNHTDVLMMWYDGCGGDKKEKTGDCRRRQPKHEGRADSCRSMRGICLLGILLRGAGF